METVFTRIRDKQIPACWIYEDDQCFVILDHNPIVKGHCLVISKDPTPTLAETPDARLAHMILVAKKVDAKLRACLNCDATNIVINNGPAAGQEVPHLHIHVIPRYQSSSLAISFTHEPYKPGEMADLEGRLKL